MTVTEGHVDQMTIGMKGTMNAIQLRDIAIKTVRGQKGRVRKGKCDSCNSYGYDVQPGKVVGGKTEQADRVVNATQAAILRRIFTVYAPTPSPEGTRR